MLIEKTFKDSIEIKGIGKNILKCNSDLYYLIQQKLLVHNEKLLILAEIKGCVM